MLKRFGCLLLAVVLLLCGCTVRQEEDEDPENKVQKSSVSDVVVWQIYSEEYAEIWQEPLNSLLKEKGASYTVDIQPYYRENAGAGDENEVEILTKMKDEYITADVISVPSGYSSSKQTGIPYYDAVTEGLLLALDEQIEQNGTKLKETVHEKSFRNLKIEGKCFGISQPLIYVAATAYNKELVEKYEIDQAELTGDAVESMELLERVKSGEETVPYVYSQKIETESGLHSIYPSKLLYQASDGGFTSLPESGELKQRLEQLNEMKEKGLIRFSNEEGEADFFAVSYDLVQTDKPYEATYRYTVNGIETEKDVIVVPDMNRPYLELQAYSSVNGVASWSDNQENAFDFLTRLFTDADIANLIEHGREGKNYILDNEKASKTDNNPLWLSAAKYTNPLLTYPTNETAQNKQAYMETHYKAYESETEGFWFDPEPVREQIEETNQVFMDENYGYTSQIKDLFYLHTQDIGEALEDLNQLLKEKGMDDIVKEAEKQFDEWKAQH